MFHLISQSGTIRCVGFDGVLRWKISSDVRSGDHYAKAGGFDVDQNGTLYTLGHRSAAVQRFAAADGKPLEPIALQIGDIQAELAERFFYDLRVQGGELFLRRKHAFELFRRYDLSNGRLKVAVNIDHERLTAASPADIWTAGRTVPFTIRLESAAKPTPPRWRIWGCTAGARDSREFPYKNDALQVPTDCAGLYQIFVTADVRPGHPGAAGAFRLRSWVEIRQPNTAGTASGFAACDSARSAAPRPSTRFASAAR